MHEKVHFDSSGQDPRMSKALARVAQIKHSKHFENGVAKIPKGNESGLPVEESDAVESLRVIIELLESSTD